MFSTSYAVAIVLLLVSSFFHSLWNLVLKKQEKKAASLFVIMSSAAVFAFVLSPWMGGLSFPNFKGILWTLGAGVFEAGYFFCLSRSYEKGALGISYAIMRGGALAIVMICSYLFLAEPFPISKVLGLVGILFGFYFSSITGSKKGYNLMVNVWPLFSAICIAGYHLFYGQALKENVSIPGLFAVSIVTSLPLLVVQNNKQVLKDLPTLSHYDFKLCFFAGLLAGASFILFLNGLSNTFAATAMALRNTSIIFSLFLGILIKEKINRWQIIGVICIFFGAVAVSSPA